MDRRFVFFLTLACAIFLANATLLQMIWPPEDVGREQPAQEGPQPGGETREVDGGDAVTDGGEEPVDQEPVTPPPRTERPDGEPAIAARPAGDGAEEWVTLGSLDAESGYRFLVVLTSRGAAIRRVALSSSRFSNLEDRSGTLGPLGPEATAGAGCRLRIVGPGTPAHAAGLAAGDILRSIDGQAIDGPDHLARFLSRTRPNQEVTLSADRDGTGLPERTVRLRRRPLEVIRPETENRSERGVATDDLFPTPPSLLMTLERLGDQRLADDARQLAGVDLYDVNWEIVERSEKSVAFRAVTAEGRIEVVKRYAIERAPEGHVSDPTYPAYSLAFDVEIRSLGPEPQSVAYRLDGPNGLPVEGWWYANKIGRTWGGVGLRDMVVRFEPGEPMLFGNSAIAGDDVEPLGQDSSLMFAGVDAQYFSAVLIPQKERLDALWFEEVRALRVDPPTDSQDEARRVNVTCRLISRPTALEAGGTSIAHHYVLFAGPKVPNLLVHYGQPTESQINLKDLVYYGWFGWVAKPMLAILHAFYGVVRNYGVAIILLTVVVRGGMFPLSLKQTRNMQKMQELQPEMKRIADKYKSDMEKRTKAQQDLFRQHNYNPMGGCLLMFIQLPIFLGLYRSLMVDVELRQAPLLSESIRWCSNLAAPDMLWDWSALMPDFVNKAQGIFGLGPYLNILPLLTVGLFVMQQKMFMPPPADEQAAMQQKIMKYMMGFMGIMFFKVASGLCLYFIASSLWGIAERKLLPKTTVGAAPQTLPERPTPERTSTSGNSPKGAGKRRKRKR